MVCPTCRSSMVRRRKRTTFAVYIASWFGKWPYRCGMCGHEFVSSERFVKRSRSRSEGGDYMVSPERASRESGRDSGHA